MDGPVPARTVAGMSVLHRLAATALSAAASVVLFTSSASAHGGLPEPGVTVDPATVDTGVAETVSIPVAAIVLVVIATVFALVGSLLIFKPGLFDGSRRAGDVDADGESS